MENETLPGEEIDTSSSESSSLYTLDDIYLYLQQINESVKANKPPEQSTETGVDYTPYLEQHINGLQNMQATLLFCLVGLGLLFGMVGALLFAEFWSTRK